MPRRTPPRSGFTLVELLVVITIIGILMGLLIPAVNAARETARRNQCSTQIKNLSLATIQYESAKRELPGYVQSFGRFAGGGDPSDPTNTGVAAHMKIGTWAVALLPWLDAQPTYEHWSEDRYPAIVAGSPDLGETGDVTGGFGEGFHTLAAPNLAIMQCPSNSVIEGDYGRNSYISNNGMSHVAMTSTPAPVTGVSLLSSQDRANGAFNCKYHVTGMDGNKGTHEFEGPRVRMDDFKDGTGNTMLFSENVQALPWYLAGMINAGDLQTADPADTDVVFTGDAAEAGRYIHGMVWHYEDPEYDSGTMATFWNNHGTGSPVVPNEVLQFHKINGGGATVSEEIFTKQMETITDARNLARPSSAHVDGVNAAMADGGTRFISESIDYRVYQALLTLRGKSSNVPWPEYVLDDENL